MFNSLVELIGLDLVKALCCAFGGTRIYFAPDGNKIDCVIDTIGKKATNTLLKQFAHESVEIPRATAYFRKERDKQLYDTFIKEGKRNADLALQFSITERSVRLIKRRMENEAYT